MASSSGWVTNRRSADEDRTLASMHWPAIRASTAMTELESNLPWSEQWRRLSLIHQDMDNAARMYEATRSIELEERKNALVAADPKMSDAAAERVTKSSPEWRERVEKEVVARSKANRIKARMDFIKMRFAEQQSFEATQRAEMKIG